MAPASLNFSPAPCAGRELVLADVGERAELLVEVGTRVGGDERDTGVDRGLDRVLNGIGVGERDGEAVDAVGDGLVDHRAWSVPRVVRALVLHRDAEVLAGLLGALLEHRPEHATITVGDDGDRDVLAGRHIDGVGGRGVGGCSGFG